MKGNGLEDAEDGVAVYVLEREIDEVRGGIDGDGVSVGHVKGSDACELRAFEVKDGNGTGFRGDVESLESGIEGEDVGVVAGLAGGGDVHGGEIDDGEGVIGLAGDEGEVGGVVECDAVGVCDAGQGEAMGDDGRGGMDGDELVEVVDSDEDVAGAGVVDGVAGSAAEGNFGDEAVGAGVDDGVYRAVLVGDEEAVGGGCVGDAVGVMDGTGAAGDLEGAGIDGEDLVNSGGGGVDAMELRDDEDAMDAGEAGQVGNNFTGAHIEDDEVIGAHVREVEQAGGGVEGLIVEAEGRTGHGDVGDQGHSATGNGARLSEGGRGCGSHDEKGGEERSAEMQHGDWASWVKNMVAGVGAEVQGESGNAEARGVGRV